MGPLYKTIFETTIKSYNYGNSGGDPFDKSIALAMDLGQEEFNLMVNAMLDEFMNDRRCLIHNDAHCFNILVEKKPSISLLENFGPAGNVFLIDWEMAVAGPQGNDPGKVICYPIACAICHAMNGNKNEAYHIVDCITEFWNHYESYIFIERKKKKSDDGIDNNEDETFMIDLYRMTLGITGSMIYLVFYQLNIFVSVFIRFDSIRFDSIRFDSIRFDLI